MILFAEQDGVTGQEVNLDMMLCRVDVSCMWGVIAQARLENGTEKRVCRMGAPTYDDADTGAL